MYVIKLVKIFYDKLCPVIRSQPVNSFQWGTETVISVRFNPGEPNVLATTARYALICGLIDIFGISIVIHCPSGM